MVRHQNVGPTGLKRVSFARIKGKKKKQKSQQGARGTMPKTLHPDPNMGKETATVFELHRWEGGGHLVYFIIQGGNCFSIIKSLLDVLQTILFICELLLVEDTSTLQ